MDYNQEKKNRISLRKIYGFFHFFIGIFALYVSIKCNNGLDLPHTITACICPHFYLIYIAATKGFDFCITDN
jgi:hypothetical protein